VTAYYEASLKVKLAINPTITPKKSEINKELLKQRYGKEM